MSVPSSAPSDLAGGLGVRGPTASRRRRAGRPRCSRSAGAGARNADDPGDAERRPGVAGEHGQHGVGGTDRRQGQVAEVAVRVEHDVVVVGQHRPQDPPDARRSSPPCAASATPTASSAVCAGSTSTPGRDLRADRSARVERRVLEQPGEASPRGPWRPRRRRGRGCPAGRRRRRASDPRVAQHDGEVGGGGRLADAALRGADSEAHAAVCQRWRPRVDARREWSRSHPRCATCDGRSVAAGG